MVRPPSRCIEVPARPRAAILNVEEIAMIVIGQFRWVLPTTNQDASGYEQSVHRK